MGLRCSIFFFVVFCKSLFTFLSTVFSIDLWLLAIPSSFSCKKTEYKLQASAKINVREKRRVNQHWAIQKHWQHWVHKWHRTKKNTTPKTKQMRNTDLTTKWGVNRGADEWWAVHASYKIPAMLLIWSRRFGHHYAKTNTNNINKTWYLLQIT